MTDTELLIFFLIIVIGVFMIFYPPKPISIIKPVYYPVDRRAPIRPRRPRNRKPRHDYKPGKDWHVGSDGKYLPADKGGIIPIKPI